MPNLKIFAAIALVILVAAAFWALVHLGKIKRALQAKDAMPQPVPATNFVLWLTILFIGLASLLIGYLLSLSRSAVSQLVLLFPSLAEERLQHLRTFLLADAAQHFALVIELRVPKQIHDAARAAVLG